MTKTFNKYHNTLAVAYGDRGRNELTEKVWRDTPWMVNAYTDSPDSDRWRALMGWCQEQFGPEARPAHSKSGQWLSGNLTAYGRTWLGFANENQMWRFMERWGSSTGHGDGGAL